MNAAQIHLMINHFPIAGSFLVVLFFIMAFVFKNKQFILSGMIIAIISGVFTIGMDLSGDGTEEIIKNKPGVTHALIKAHEEAADKTLIVMVLMALAAGVWFYARSKKPAWISKIEIGVFVLGIISSGLIANTAHLGGMIRHDEIRTIVATQIEKI
ncbi:MAG: hypothetical protein H7177_07055 [Rhizobacter sp.]|nr:hypothetical protein [Bacteriovorax sp.]